MRSAAAVLIVAACGTHGASDIPIARDQVALVPVADRQDIDLLFVLDDSIGGLEMQTYLKAAFPAFLSELTTRRELPSLHIGVVSSDLGALGAEDSAPGTGVGSGPGSCNGFGRNAALQTNMTTLITGKFIADIRNSDGTRTVNYTGTLTNAFAAIASLGGSGCGFEQPLEAMKRALDNHPDNAGFVRDVPLAIVVLTDEDDCSFARSSFLDKDQTLLGPLQSFRCTRFGVVCDEGGTTTEEMYVIGEKSRCHWADDSPYLTLRTRYETFLRSVHGDPRDILLTAIAGAPGRGESLEVEARTPPGGGTAIPALKHTCRFNGALGAEVADPALRIKELTGAVPRGRFEDICDSDYMPDVLAIAREIRGMLGDSCLTRDIAVPADCEVFDQTLVREVEVPRCSTTRKTDCYQLVEDEACTTSHHLRVEVTRSGTPPADTMVAVRCRL
ncbi:MAG TPA: hypothetical protein VIV11_02510 [Kofleriaceae bacterium]